MTNAVKITIHAAGSGLCALTGREADGLTVSFDDGVVKEQHLSWKAFRQILCMRTVQQGAALPGKPSPFVAQLAPAAPANSVAKQG